MGAKHDAYFGALADEVVNALAAAGFPKCDSRVMATEPAWRMSLGEWLGRLDPWMAEPDILYSFLSGIVFDYRQIGGTFSVVPTRSHHWEGGAQLRVSQEARFSCSRPQVAPGLLGGIRTTKVDRGQRTLDIKKAGLFPVTETARALALASGVADPSTLERLRRVAENPEWSEVSASLTQVFKSM